MAAAVRLSLSWSYCRSGGAAETGRNGLPPTCVSAGRTREPIRTLEQRALGRVLQVIFSAVRLKESSMFKKALLCASVAGSVCMLPTASADDTLARFKGGIGDIPLATSTVRGVNAAGQIWVIDKLEAKVSYNGRIVVEGKGLVFGGGDNVGRATTQSVIATFICDGDATLYSSSQPGVRLTPTGDFRINDRLTPVPPGNCANPVLLIRNAANGGGGWFAAGILRPDKDD
jgi:hypothetical protein